MMDRETLGALKRSIKKWRRVRLYKGTDEGPQNCSLCGMFHGAPNNCSGCPVQARTGYIGCMKTPYEEWLQHQQECHEGRDDGGSSAGYTVRCKVCKRLAKAEEDFLKSLLPKERWWRWPAWDAWRTEA